MTAGLGVLVIVAGGVGALARFELSVWAQRRFDPRRPWGTVAVNVVGTALLATLLAAWRGGLLADGVVMVAGAGFCGGFTTFSTWMLEVVRAAETGGVGRRVALVDLAGQLAAGLAAALLVLAV